MMNAIFLIFLTSAVLGLRIPVSPELSLTDCSLNNYNCYSEFSLVTDDQQIYYHLNGEPKSGTTWMEFVVDSLMEHECAGDSSCHLHVNERNSHLQDNEMAETFVPNHKHHVPVAGKLGHDHGGGFDFSPAPKFSADLIDEHVKELLSSDSESRWLSILRDPRDVLVSACYHENAEGNCNEFVKEKFRNTVDWIKLRHAVFRAIGQQSKETRAYIVLFESLKQDFKGEARRIADFLGLLKLSDEDMNKVKFETSLGEMKKQEEQGKVPKGGAKQKVRKGEACAFQADLNDKVVNTITKYMEDTLPLSLYSRWAC